MKHKFSRNYSLSAVVPFVPVLIALVAFAALAQTAGAGQRSAQHAVAPAQQDTGAPASALLPLPLPGATNAVRTAVSRMRTNRHGALPMDGTPLGFFLEPYDSGGVMSVWIAVGDLNGDGKPDLVVVNLLSGVSVLLGNGDGTFQAPVHYSSGGFFPLSVAIGDLRGNGILDLVVACNNTGQPGAVSVLLGNGDGTFHQPVVYASGAFNASSVAIGDVNGDGHPDLVVTNENFGMNEDGAVGVLLGNGDGTFQSPVSYDPGGSGAWSVAIADVNGDGKPDLIAANELSSNVGVLLGNGDGTFQPVVTYSSGGTWPISVAVRDVNSDGKLDIVATNLASGTVGVLLGNGDGTFQPAATYNSGGGAYSVVITDMNGDGNLDLVVADGYSDSVSVLLGNGHGTFQSPLSYWSGGYIARSAAVADLNGDGKPDLIVANGCLSTANCWASGTGYGDGEVVVLMNNSGAPPTTTAVVSNVNPVPPKKWVTYTAAVTTQNGGAATGTIFFQDGGVTVATVSVANNQAAYSATYKKDGVHAITAVYSGDFNNAGSTSATLQEYVGFPVPTVTHVTTSGSFSQLGQPVTFTATVTPKEYGPPPDGELVTFYDGKAVMGTAALAGGTAAYTTSTLSAGKHSIKADYPGDGIFKPSKGSVVQVVEE